MKMSLTAFKTLFRERLFDVLWRQWTALGVMGQAKPMEQTVLDPEALFLITCTVGRYDPRLFDAMLDWLAVNGRYLNVHRLRRIQKEHTFTGAQVYSAVAAIMQSLDSSAKWTRSAAPRQKNAEPLFLMDDHTPLPVLHEPDSVFQRYGYLRERYEPRNIAQIFPSARASNLILRLRALLGISARCEILAYLMIKGRGSPRAIARICNYYPATISKAMAEMEDSGYITSHTEGRHRFYALLSPTWRDLLIGEEMLAWIHWPVLFSALEQVWLFLHSPDHAQKSELTQASALRRILKNTVIDNLNRSGLSTTLNDEKEYTGERLIPYFIDRMENALNELSSRL